MAESGGDGVLRRDCAVDPRAGSAVVRAAAVDSGRSAESGTVPAEA